MIGQNRKFGLVTGSACLVICAYKLIFHHPGYSYFGIPGSILVLTAVIAPAVLNPLRILWGKIGQVLGTINSYVILTLVFFIVITPIELILRLMKKDLLKLNKSEEATYWQPKGANENSSLKQQF